MNDYPRAYIEYLVHFHGTRDYFECHEILEDHWNEDGRKPHWKALIQLAVAVYHERQKNEKGSLRLYKKVLNFLRTNPEMLSQVAIDYDRLKVIVKNRIRNILEENPYKPLNLPLTDEKLIQQCVDECEKRKIKWCEKEDLTNTMLIYKHKHHHETKTE